MPTSRSPCSMSEMCSRFRISVQIRLASCSADGEQFFNTLDGICREADLRLYFLSIVVIARVLRGQNNIVPALSPSDDLSPVHHTTLVMEKLRLHRVQSFRDTLSYFVWVDTLTQDLLKSITC